MSHPAASRIPLYIGEVYKPCVSGLFLDDIRLATCPVESHRVGLSDASHNTLDTQPLFKFFLMSSDSEALFDTLMNELIHQMSGQTAPLGNGHPRDIPATDPAPNSTLLIVYSLLIIEDRDAGFAQRDPEELGSSGLRVDCLDPCHGWSPTSVAGLVLETDPSRGFSARPEHSQTSRRRGGFSVTPLLSL